MNKTPAEQRALAVKDTRSTQEKKRDREDNTGERGRKKKNTLIPFYRSTAVPLRQPYSFHYLADLGESSGGE